jgi:hypothetical protein
MVACGFDEGGRWQGTPAGEPPSTVSGPITAIGDFESGSGTVAAFVAARLVQSHAGTAVQISTADQ